MEAWIAALVAVFRECRRVLRDTGSFWLNVGHGWGGGGLPDGSLLMLPARLALALQADGWLLRSEVVWAKPAPMPESVDGWAWSQHRVKVKDGIKHSGGTRGAVNGSFESSLHTKGRYAEWVPCPGCATCAPNDGLVLARSSWRATKAHEMLYQFAKGMHYYGDREAVAEAVSPVSVERTKYGWHLNGEDSPYAQQAKDGLSRFVPSQRNPRSVQTWGPEPLGEINGTAHYAAYPTALPAWCIKVSTSERGVCATCGAPWARVVARRPGSIRGGGFQDETRGHEPQERLRDSGESRTLGWRATCACPEAAPVPAVVLDCFAGSGSTLVAAVRLGRRAVGIELNPRYAAMARQRIATDAPQGNVSPETAQPGAQMAMGGLL